MSPELDTAMFDHLFEQRIIGRPVNNKDLCSKALELAQSGEFDTVPSTFKPYAMWLKQWKKVPSDYEDGFREAVIQSHLEHRW